MSTDSLRTVQLVALNENARVLRAALVTRNVRHLWTGTKAVHLLRWDPRMLRELPVPFPGGCALLQLRADHDGHQNVLTDADDLCLQNVTSPLDELVTIFSDLVAVDPVTMADVVSYLQD